MKNEMNIFLSLKNRSHWEPDKDADKCRSCQQGFTATQRRHHCRLCAMTYCSVRKMKTK